MRLKALMDVFAGKSTVSEACERMGVCESRYFQIKEEMMESCLKSLEPRASGRPRREPTPAELRIQELETEVKRLKLDLDAQRVRAEIALLMPEVFKGSKKNGAVDKSVFQGILKAMKGKDQRPRRREEARVRREAVSFVDRARAEGMEAVEASSLILVNPSTLKEWRQRIESDSPTPPLLGRPAYEDTNGYLKEIAILLHLVGPYASVPFVWDLFPEVPRSVVEDKVRDFKRGLRSRLRSDLLSVSWRRPGRVWSVDWTDLEAPIDFKYDKLLVVRDLASSFVLMALPVEKKSAELFLSVLKHLFKIHGAPLVLKSDLGSEFTAAIVAPFLWSQGVSHLLSPAHYPQYNGAIEAGMGSLKSRALYQAMRNGRVGCFSMDDIEAARLQSNEISRPWGRYGQTPEHVFKYRFPILWDERRAFLEDVSRIRESLPGSSLTDSQPLRERRSKDRHAIVHALLASKDLTMKRRGFTLGEFRGKTTDIR